MGAWRPDAPPAIRAPLAGPWTERVVQALPLEGTTCALFTSGQVRCIGIHPRGIQQSRALRDAVQLVGHHGYACALHADGHVTCWGVGAPGRDRSHEPHRIEGVTQAVQLVSGTSFMCALNRDRSVICWGDNRFGQLGDGTQTAHDDPQPVTYSERDAAELAAGSEHACLRTIDGRVMCWGHNDQGQVHATGEDVVLVPELVPDLASARRVAAGGDLSCISTASQVVCWGNGACGQRGVLPALNCSRHRTPREDSGPQVAFEGEVSALSVGELHVCAQRVDPPLTLCWGADGEGQLGRGAIDGMTRTGTCHPRAGVCASEVPSEVAAVTDDPSTLPVGAGIAWQPAVGMAGAPRPDASEVSFEVFDAQHIDPAAVSRILPMTLRDPLLSCYRRTGTTQVAREILVNVVERGTEIPTVTLASDADGADLLGRCLRATFARGYYSLDGDGQFSVRTRFSPNAWDGML